VLLQLAYFQELFGQINNFLLNNITFPILVFPTKIPASPPLASPLILLREYESSFNTEDDKVEILAWITQALEYAVRKAGGNVASRSARFGQLQFRTFSTTFEAPLPSLYSIKIPAVPVIAAAVTEVLAHFRLTICLYTFKLQLPPLLITIHDSDFRRTIPSLLAISSEPLCNLQNW
jgi:hypothetical protein